MAAKLTPSSGRFTIHDDPAVDQRITADLTVIQRVICASVSDVCALILAGGFGRGEGTVDVEGGDIRPVNDYDIVVVTTAGVPAQALLQRISRELALTLRIRFVDLTAVARAELAQLPATIFFFDLKNASFVFHGDQRILAEIPDHRPADIPLTDAWTQLCNRLVCLMETFPGAENDGSLVRRQASKAVFAVCDAVLLSEGLYFPSYREKVAAMLRRTSSEHEAHILREALAAKLGRASADGESPAKFWRSAAAFFLPAVQRHLQAITHCRSTDLDALLGTYVRLRHPRRHRWPARLLPLSREAQARCLEAAEIAFLSACLAKDGRAPDEAAYFYRRATRSFRAPRNPATMSRRLVNTWYALHHH